MTLQVIVGTVWTVAVLLYARSTYTTMKGVKRNTGDNCQHVEADSMSCKSPYLGRPLVNAAKLNLACYFREIFLCCKDIGQQCLKLTNRGKSLFVWGSTVIGLSSPSRIDAVDSGVGKWHQKCTINSNSKFKRPPSSKLCIKKKPSHVSSCFTLPTWNTMQCIIANRGIENSLFIYCHVTSIIANSIFLQI